MIVSSPTFRVIFPPFSLSFFTLLDHYYHTVSSILFPVLFISHIYTIQYVSNQKERIIFTILTHINIIFCCLPSFTYLYRSFLSFLLTHFPSFFLPSLLPSLLPSFPSKYPCGDSPAFHSLPFTTFLIGMITSYSCSLLPSYPRDPLL